MTLLSQTEYADRRGCTQQYISKLIKQGRITLVNGRIDPDLADKQIEQSADPLHPKNRQQNQAAEEKFLHAQAACLINDTKLRKLNIEINQGKWLLKSDARKIGFDNGRIIRDRLLAIYEQYTPQLNNPKTCQEAEVQMRQEVQKLFTETRQRMNRQIYRAANKLADQAEPDEEDEDDDE